MIVTIRKNQKLVVGLMNDETGLTLKVLHKMHVGFLKVSLLICEIDLSAIEIVSAFLYCLNFYVSAFSNMSKKQYTILFV